jgi:hypothetical protein
MDEWIEICLTASKDERLPKRQQEDALRLVEQMREGIVPSPVVIRKIQKALIEPAICARLLEDRSCSWLRKNAASQGLRMPRAGEKVFCKRQLRGTAGSLFDECDGYRERRATEGEEDDVAATLQFADIRGR